MLCGTHFGGASYEGSHLVPRFAPRLVPVITGPVTAANYLIVNRMIEVSGTSSQMVVPPFLFAYQGGIGQWNLSETH